MKRNEKIEKTAAAVAFAASAGYLLRFISHYTYYVIKIKYAESFLYGLIPCILIAFFGITLLLKNIRKPLLNGLAACVVTVFSLAVAAVGGGDEADSASIIVFVMGVLFSVLYFLTITGKIKNPIPLRVMTTVCTAVYFIMVFVTCYVYIPSDDPVNSYYGVIGSVAGLALFYLSAAICSYSMKMNIVSEDA
ncbi:MAG: hypothetical protein MJ177_07140 [Clostridia bacterium]|nr:hypothetical protein [Clostridia bacterium]